MARPSSRWTHAASTWSRAIPKREAPASTTQLLVDDTAHRSQPCSASWRVSSSISGKMRGVDDFDKKLLGRPIEDIDGDATMHGDHLAAHRLFVDFSRFVKPSSVRASLRRSLG